MKKALLLLVIFSLLIFSGFFNGGYGAGEAEDLFQLGYRDFKAGNYDRARRHFQKLVNNFFDSPRRRDAFYFLDKIKLYSRQNDAPRIRVLLAAKISLRERSNVRTLVKTRTKSFQMGSGSEWRASVSDGQVLFRGSQEFRADRIVLESLGDRYLKFNGKKYRGSLELKVYEGEIYVINRLPMHYYLYGVIEKEIAPGWPIQTVKAQAVAARSFAIYRIKRNIEEPYDLGTTWLAQLYAGVEAETPQVIEAVDETRGEVLTYQGVVVPGFFHANSGGYIEKGEDVWEGTPTPYIIPGEDTWSIGVQHDRWSERISVSEINSSLHENGHPAIGPFDSLRVERRLESGRAAALSYITEAGSRYTIRADRFRMAVGPEKIRSAWFVNIEPRGRDILFEGRGWGHGIGMSQWGAWNMGEQGFDYQDIIKFYFRGAKLTANYGPGVVTSAP